MNDVSELWREGGLTKIIIKQSKHIIIKALPNISGQASAVLDG